MLELLWVIINSKIPKFLNYFFRKLKPVSNAIISTCNMNCNCKKEWNPVCDPRTGQTYYSACYAGCMERIDNNSVSFLMNLHLLLIIIENNPKKVSMSL